MALLKRLRSTRVLLSAGLLLGLAAGPLTVHPAGATFSTCSTDPKVWVSNGTKITLTPQITDAASDVTGITYTIHGPIGTTLSNIVYTGSLFSGLETVVYIPDQGGTSSYLIDTMVSTLVPGQNVTVPVNVLDTSDHLKDASSASGISGQDVLLQLSY